MNFKTKLLTHKKTFDALLSKFLKTKKKNYSLIDSTLSDMFNIIVTHILRGGKRLRPFLALTAYKLASQKTNEKNDKSFIKTSLAVELLHQYILIHDDIADRDQKRYQGKTIELVYQDIFKNKYKKTDPHLGLSLALITGDLVSSLAHQTLLESNFPPKTIIKALKLMQQAIVETISGWQIHFFQNQLSITSKKVNEKNYLKGLKLVSERYTFFWPIKFGLLLAQDSNNNSNKKLKSALSAYSHNIGHAFQIKDDILGMFGKTKNTGKPIGNDFIEGKKTLLLIQAYKKASLMDQKFIEKYLGTPITPLQLKTIQKIIVNTKSLKYSENKAKKYASKAKISIAKIKTKSNYSQIELLENLADFVINRNH